MPALIDSEIKQLLAVLKNLVDIRNLIEGFWWNQFKVNECWSISSPISIAFKGGYSYISRLEPGTLPILS